MRRIALAALACAAFSAGAGQSASAADLAVKARPMAPVPISDWSGVYVGVEAGYGWGKQTTDFTDPGYCWDYSRGECRTFGGENNGVYYPDATIGSIKHKGWLAGGFFGAQKQWGAWVLGIEANLDGADIKGSASTSATNIYTVYRENLFILDHSLSATSTVDMLGSVRGKVGVAASPNWLFYGTGGLAFAHVKNSATNSFSSLAPWGTFYGPYTASVSGATSLFGWVAGAGIDYKIMQDAGSSWVLGVEYLHYQFDSNSFALNNGFGYTVSFNGKQSVDTVVGRVSYLFAIH